MTLDDWFRTGQTLQLGTHLFTADEIRRFAGKFDPQPFHVDEEAAKSSVFGGLCASGWHTASVWMKLNVQHRRDPSEWKGDGLPPKFGPSPGFRDLRWMKPVFAGQTISYSRKALEHRAVTSRPGWRLLTVEAAAHNEDGANVLEFFSAVLVDVSGA